MPSYGMLCKPPDGEAYAWGLNNPEVINGWHWWGYDPTFKTHMSRSLEVLQSQIRGYERAGKGWRYQIVRTG